MVLEPISKALQELSPKSTPSRKTSDPVYAHPQDAPAWQEPTTEQRRSDWLTKYGGVTSLGHTFESMRCPKGFKPTLEAFSELAAGTAPWHMLLVYGGTGNGKSRSCEALTIALYDKGVRGARREKWSDIIRFTLKAAFHSQRPDALTYEQTFKTLRERTVLIIDDVGMGSTGGNWEWGELEDIVDYRIEHNLLTVITTNLDLKEIPPRIVSRFRDRTHCRLVCDDAPDQRPLEGK